MQAGANPQHLLMTIFGDYWLGREDPLPAGALIDLLEEFGITEASARAAFSRLARRGAIDRHRTGREVMFAPSPQTARQILSSAQRLITFGSEEPDWDGDWTVVMFSVPENRRDLRHIVRSHLRWRSFAPIYDGAWVSPRADPREIADMMAELGVAQVSVIRTREVTGSRSLAAAWDIERLGQDYATFARSASALAEELDSIPPARALVERTRLMDAWRTFPARDPELPASVVGADWPRRAARASFVRAFDGLAPLASSRVREIVERHQPGLAALVSFHSTTELRTADS